MAEKAMSARVLNVTNTPSAWAAETKVIPKGLLCVEIGTDGKTMIKIGDGVKTYPNLPYVIDGSFSISDYYTSTETDEKISAAITALGTIIHIKGIKPTVEELPKTDNEIGDLWFVGTVSENSVDDFSEYIWTEGNRWEFVGRVQTEVDLTDYAKTSYVDGEIKKVVDRVTALESKSHDHTNKSILDGTTESFTTELKNKLDAIDANANKYELPTASSTVLGGVKIGTNLTIDENGVLSSITDTEALEKRVKAIEDDYIKSTDELTLNCEI